MMMRLHDMMFRELGARDEALWNRFAAPGGRLISPYLRFEFARAVSRVRDDVRVIIAERDDRPCAYLPYHAVSGGVARPLAAPMSDYQGMVCAPDASIAPAAMLKAMSASAFIYDNWATTPAPGQVRSRAGSAVIDLTDGPEAWMARHRGQHRNHFRKIDRRLRQAEACFGPARLELGDPDGTRFDTLRRLKSTQYVRSGKLDLFSISWVDQLLSALAGRETGPFGGLVASLYFGDRLAAVEMGICAGGVYHSWFPAYEPDFARVSPGLQLLHALIARAPDLGLTRIDLGKGDAGYKNYYTDYETPLFEGRALNPGLAAARVTAWEATVAASRVLPGPFADAPLKLRRRWSQAAAFEPALSAKLARMGEAVTSAATGAR